MNEPARLEIKSTTRCQSQDLAHRHTITMPQWFVLKVIIEHSPHCLTELIILITIQHMLAIKSSLN